MQPSNKTAIDYQLDEMLILWHQHRHGYKVGRGYAGQDSTCRDYRAPTHFDWQNGAADARADALLVHGISEAMEKIPDTPERWNTALQFEAMNLATGSAVFSSPRLPQSREEREILTLEARTMLLRVLRRAGVLG